MSRHEVGPRAARRWGPVAPEDELPPLRPPDALLEAATSQLTEHLRVGRAAVSWRCGPPISRPHSHLLPLTAELRDGRRVDAWYKVGFVPRGSDGTPDGAWLHQAQAGIDRGRRAAKELAHRYRKDPSQKPPLLLPEILASEPASLRILMAAVPGRPIGRLLSLSPRRLLRLRRTFRAIGSSIRIVESLVDNAPSLEATGARDRLLGARRLATTTGALPSAARAAVEIHTERLLTALEAEGEAAYVHGDLSGSNVLLRASGGVGLIDLDWRPRPRAFDLATYSVRLQLESPRLERLTLACLESLLLGYGDHAKANPGFLLERSQRWLRLLREGVVDLDSTTGRRVIEELKGGRPWLP